jgi:hypothetical protein
METADWWMIEFHFTINLKAKIKIQARYSDEESIHETFPTIETTTSYLCDSPIDSPTFGIPRDSTLLYV